jgi:formiminoglutamase
VGGINIDPHLDVRETIGSGMPFRALIEAHHLEPARFTTLGAGRFTNSRAHSDWLASRGGTITPITALLRDPAAAIKTALNHAGHRAFVSFDLDALDAAFAPGVSAINPAGLSPLIAAALCEAAGADPRVQHFDLMELSPPHDPDGRTARLAALLFLSFLAGFTRRDQAPHPGANP